MKHLKQIITEIKENYRLTQTQQEVLALSFASPTPQIAYNQTVGAENLYSARGSLEEWGFVDISNNAVHLTDKGKDALTSYGIVVNNELTDYGEKLIRIANDDAEEWN